MDFRLRWLVSCAISERSTLFFTSELGQKVLAFVVFLLLWFVNLCPLACGNPAAMDLINVWIFFSPIFWLLGNLPFVEPVVYCQPERWILLTHFCRSICYIPLLFIQQVRTSLCMTCYPHLWVKSSVVVQNFLQPFNATTEHIYVHLWWWFPGAREIHLQLHWACFLERLSLKPSWRLRLVFSRTRLRFRASDGQVWRLPGSKSSPFVFFISQ